MNLRRRSAAYLLVLLLASCSSNPTAQPDSGNAQDISNVIYVGGVTDEALKRLLDLTPKDDPRQAVVLDSPDLSQPLPKDSPATLTFHLASEAKRTPGTDENPTRNPKSKWQRPLHEFWQFLAPEGTAHAHGTPYNGNAYRLVIKDANSKTRLQVFTPETSFTPDAMAWQDLVQAPQPLTLQITSAFFEENDIPADGGPFVGGSFPFRIE